MHYTFVFTSLFVTLYFAQPTDLQLGQFEMHNTLVFASPFLTL